MFPFVVLVLVLFALGALYVVLESVPLALLFTGLLAIWITGLFLGMRILRVRSRLDGVTLTLAAAGCAIAGTASLLLSSTLASGILGLAAAMLFSISAVARSRSEVP